MSNSILTLPPPRPHARLAYGDDPAQFADLYLPPSSVLPAPAGDQGANGRPTHPVLVMVHGGFWRSVYDLAHVGHLCAALAAEGYAVYSLEYRRLGQPGGGWPGTFLDVASAVEALPAVAATYPLDLGRVAAVGHSAGGHLALWLAGRHRVPSTSDLWAPVETPLRGAVSLAGVVDLRRASGLSVGAGVVDQLLGGRAASLAGRLEAGSPYELLPLGLGVLQVLIHGDRDEIVPLELSRRYATRANSLADTCTLTVLPGLAHFELIDPRSAAWPSVLAAVRTVLDG